MGRGRFKSRIGRTILYTLALAGWSGIAFRGLGDRLLVEVKGSTIVSPGSSSRMIAEGIEVWIARSPGALHREPSAWVLVFPGTGVRADEIIDAAAKYWGEHPVEVWAMNYPGSGNSAGPAKIASVPEKALAAYDAIARAAHGRPVVVTGNSFGTTAALYVAASRPVGALILQNPVPLRRVILGKYGWWNLWIGAAAMAMQVPDELCSISNSAQITIPACFLISENDDIVPMDYQRMILDAYPGHKHSILLKGFGHSIPVNHPDLRRHWTEAIEWAWPSVVGKMHPAD